MLQFPKNFYWGAATSSYQVEGNNTNADWWQWEIKAGKERSGAACRHYELYPEDFDLIKSLHHNAHRFSIEWSRIEPREGEFSQSELQHYIDVLKALRARGIEPMVTLHHFTNPLWFSQSGNWLKSNSIKRFERYCEVVVKALAPYVRYWFTINEPTVYFSHAFLWGIWPPQSKSLWATKAVHDHMNEAHIQVYRRIHQIYKESSLPAPMVSIAQHMQAMVACTKSTRDQWAKSIREYWYNLEILDRLHRAGTLDYIGVNYYTRHLVHTHSWRIDNLFMVTCQENHHPLKKNFLGWDTYPEGLKQVLLSLRKYNVPVIISENGTCNEDDKIRWEYIQSHLKAVHEAMAQGVDVQGFLYWSLMDNFEWAYGYAPRFGLIDINYTTQQRIIRPSALKYAQICQTSTLEL